MTVQRLDEQTIELGGLDLLCCELIQQIPISADPGDSEAARERLFTPPTNRREERFEQDWKEYVEPELHRLFQSTIEIVQEDIKDFPSGEPSGEHSLRLPIKNLEAWIHALNQARLALAARYNFTEQDMDGKVPIEGDTRALALFQVHFYGFIQECFLRELEA